MCLLLKQIDLQFALIEQYKVANLQNKETISQKNSLNLFNSLKNSYQ